METLKNWVSDYIFWKNEKNIPKPSNGIFIENYFSWRTIILFINFSFVYLVTVEILNDSVK